MAAQSSKVCEHFGKTAEDESKFACDVCNVVVKAKDGNTTNLHKHLKRRHGIDSKLSDAKKKKMTQR